MSRDKVNFVWFLIAGLAVCLLAAIHPFGLMQLASFVLLAGFFFYLAYESYKFEKSDTEYGHPTGIKMHPKVAQMIRSAAFALPAMLLFYLISYIGFNYL